jgi:hypothetical protein
MHFILGFESEDVSSVEGYKPISPTLNNLPSSTKTLLISKFKEFVNNDWAIIKNGLEIFDEDELIDGSNMSWDDRFTNLSNTIKVDNLTDEKLKEMYSGELLKTDVYKYFPKIRDNGNYIYLSPLKFYDEDEVDVSNNYDLHMKPNTNVMKVMLRLYGDSKIIKNNYNVWANGSTEYNLNSNLDDMRLYIQSFVEEYDKLTKEEEDEAKKTRDSLKDKLFNTINDDIIKLNLYRTLSSVYNKWVAGSGSSNLFSQCGGGFKSTTDTSGEGSPDKNKLINTFRFIDRSFNEIGEDLIINPTAFTNLFTESLNKSAYDLIATVLTSNYMDFIPLPTFVDFKDIDEVAKMFRPYSYKDIVSNSESLTVGPAFICMYVGQTSNNLDISTSSYADDGIFIQATSTGENKGGIDDDVDLLILDGKNGITNDFIASQETGTTIPVIGVSYGQQNQNFFKDITLNQAEFTETEESLIIIDEIANWGNTNKKTPIGQNLFNVFQTRSYNATVEAMGNPLIQPMMYFQLNNMPMFRGLYTILSVNHKITPNHMTTSFTGNRIRAVKTPLIKSETIYMNLIGSVDGTTMTGEGGAITDSRRGTGATSQDPNLADFIDTPITYNLINPINNNEKQILSDTTDLGFKIQPGDIEYYGIREFIELLQLAFNDFKGKALIDKSYNPVVYINDISALGGGDIGHKSHKRGVDIDLRQIAIASAPTATFPNDNPKTGAKGFFGDITSSDGRDEIGNYSRKGTRELIKSLLKYAGKPYTSFSTDNKYQINPKFDNTKGVNQEKVQNEAERGILINTNEELLNAGVKGGSQNIGVTLITKFEETNVRTSPNVNNGYINNIDRTVNGTDSPVGQFIRDRISTVDKYRWFQVKSSDGKFGWVRSDTVTFKPQENRSEKSEPIILPNIDIIYFNDPVLVDEFSELSRLASHSNHLHIRVIMPDRVENEKLPDGTGENSRKFSN